MARAKCKGKSRQTGEACKLSVVEGREFCRFHGGSVPTGPNHWNWKGGRYAKAVPNRYLRSIAKSLDDPNLTSLRDSIALIDARLIEELENLDKVASSDLWDDLLNASYKIEGAIEDGDDDKLTAEAMKVVRLIRAGVDIDQKWDSVMATIERRAKLTERERSRERDLKAYMTAEQAIEFTTRIVEIAGELFEDRRRFQTFIDRVLATPALAQIPAETGKKGVIDAEIVHKR